MYENTFVGRVDRFRIYGFYEDRLEELLSIIPYEVVNKWNNSKVTWSENTSTGQKKKKKNLSILVKTLVLDAENVHTSGCNQHQRLLRRFVVRHPSLNDTSFVPPCRPISYYYANPISILLLSILLLDLRPSNLNVVPLEIISTALFL